MKRILKNKVKRFIWNVNDFRFVAFSFFFPFSVCLLETRNDCLCTVRSYRVLFIECVTMVWRVCAMAHYFIVDGNRWWILRRRVCLQLCSLNIATPWIVSSSVSSTLFRSSVLLVTHTHTCAVRIVFGRLGRVAYVCLLSISEASVLTVILFSNVVFFVLYLTVSVMYGMSVSCVENLGVVVICPGFAARLVKNQGKLLASLRRSNENRFGKSHNSFFFPFFFPCLRQTNSNLSKVLSISMSENIFLPSFGAKGIASVCDDVRFSFKTTNFPLGFRMCCWCNEKWTSERAMFFSLNHGKSTRTPFSASIFYCRNF